MSTKKGKNKPGDDSGGNVLQRASKARSQKSAPAHQQTDLKNPEKISTSSDDEEGHHQGGGAGSADSLTRPMASKELRNQEADRDGSADQEEHNGTSGAQDSRQTDSSEQTHGDGGSAIQEAEPSRGQSPSRNQPPKTPSDGQHRSQALTLSGGQNRPSAKGGNSGNKEGATPASATTPSRSGKTAGGGNTLITQMFPPASAQQSGAAAGT